MGPNKIVGSDVNLNNTRKEMEREAAKGAARSVLTSAQDTARSGAVELKRYVVENPTSLKILCFATGILLFAFSILGIIWIPNLASPIAYIINIFNMFFAVIIVVSEGSEKWSFFGAREKIFNNLGFLTYPAGRAGFYVYVGVMVLGILPEGGFMKILYIIMGGVLGICGALQLLMIYCYKKDGAHSRLPEVDAAGGNSSQAI